MKKLFCVLLALLLSAVLFAACEKPPAPGPETSAPDETLPSADVPPTQAPSTVEPTTLPADPAFEPVNRYIPASPKDEAGWKAEAKARFGTACETFFKYMCSSSWLEVDRSAQAIYDIYYPVENFSSLREAEAPFLEVFSEHGFGTALESVLLERDGKLYAALADRGADDAYKGFDIEKIDKISDGYIEFTVRTHYSDGDDLSRFALLWERGAYRVDKFEMPY